MTAPTNNDPIQALNDFKAEIETFNKLPISQQKEKVEELVRKAFVLQNDLIIKYNVPAATAIELAIDIVLVAKFIINPTDIIGCLQALAGIVDIIKVIARKKKN